MASSQAKLDEHPLFERMSEAGLQLDPAATLLTEATEEGQKVARNQGKVCLHLAPAAHSAAQMAVLLIIFSLSRSGKESTDGCQTPVALDLVALESTPYLAFKRLTPLSVRTATDCWERSGLHCQVPASDPLSS